MVACEQPIAFDLAAAFAFLDLTGWTVQAEEAAAVLVFLDLAAGKLDEKQLALKGALLWMLEPEATAVQDDAWWKLREESPRGA